MFGTKLAVACGLMIATTGAASAATLTTIDLTALQGTSWSNIAVQPVRINFGTLGMGSVSMVSVNGGAFINAETPVQGLPYYNYTATLGSGDILNSLPNGTSVFSILSPTAGSPSGFNLNFTLDSGNFLAGTAFTIGSLDLSSATTLQAFSPGAGFGAMDTASLPSDGMSAMTSLGSGGLGTLYGNTVMNSVSDTRAFQLLGAQNSFTIQMLQSPGGRGGISFSLATPAVPEPATWLMMILGFGLVGGTLRRRTAKVALA